MPPPTTNSQKGGFRLVDDLLLLGSFEQVGEKAGSCLIYLLINNERGQVTIYNNVLLGLVPLYTLYPNKKC
jgi:hypothetical protein